MKTKFAACPHLPHTRTAAAVLAVCLGQAVWADIPPGGLDPSFGDGGIVTTNFTNESDAAFGLAIRNGVIVAAGKAGGQESRFALAAYNPDGTPLGNPVTTTFPGGFSEARSVAWTRDGGVVAAGTVFQSERRFALAKYSYPDWHPVPFFGEGGRVITDWTDGGRGRAVAVRPDGRILVAGMETKGTFRPNEDFALARYHPQDGSLDTSFDGDGKLSTGFGGQEHANALAIQPDGKIVAAGHTSANGRRFALARYLTADGKLDPEFGGNGKVTTLFNDGRYEEAKAVAIQPDGKIIAAGYVYLQGNDAQFRYMALARYLPDGSLDPGFGDGGRLLWHPDPASQISAYANAIALQIDGKIVVAGRVTQSVALARFNPDGSLDNGFGDNGLVQPFDNDSEANAAAIQPDGRIVIAGRSGGQFLLARFHARTYTGVEIILDSIPSNPTSDPLPSFEFHMTAPGNVFHCFLESAAVQGYWHRCGSPFVPAAPLEDGEWLFKVRGRDEHGNYTPPAEYRFIVDTAAPPDNPGPDEIFSDRFQGGN